MTRIAVTGADGFVGRHLCLLLSRQGHGVVPLVRDEACAAVYESLGIPGAKARIVGDIGPETTWRDCLDGSEAIIHLAARVHVMKETAADALSAFRTVNRLGTARLAQAAAEAKISRMVYISTIKVNGESTDGRAPFQAGDPPLPQCPYSVSKHEAELALCDVASRTGLEVVIVRPPLVHGPGVGGNLERLLRQVASGRLLPFGGLANRRSLVGVRNLADALASCAIHPDAAGRTFLVSDGEDLSVEDLVREMAAGLGRVPRLLPVPIGPARFLLGLVGKGAIADRLFGALLVDSGPIQAILGWRPPLTAREGIRDMCRACREPFVGFPPTGSD